MPRVINAFTEIITRIPATAVFIGRPTKWGNPFVIGRDGTRSEVIKLYEQYLVKSQLMHSLHELEDKDLVCYCAPKACHGDVLLLYANRGRLPGF